MLRVLRLQFADDMRGPECLIVFRERNLDGRIPSVAGRDRFQITGRGRDLENCLEAHERALAEPVPVPEDQAGLLANYSGALLAMFEHDGDGEILGHALVAARMATDLARTAAHPRRAKTVAELAKRYAAAPAARHRARRSAAAGIRSSVQSQLAR